MEITDTVDMGLDKLQDTLGQSAFVLFGQSIQKSRKPLILYTLLTLLCYCLDGINFLIQYKLFG